MIGFGKRFWLNGLAVLAILLSVSSDSVFAGDDTRMQDEISFYELEEQLMVTATKRKISVRKAPAIATVITADEIKNMGARDLTDVLRTVPGFGVSKNVYGRQMYDVRGFQTSADEKILVMMDGHRLNESYTGSALGVMFEDLSVENARQIEIIRGPGSAIYGANAFLAVVNIITKEPEDTDGIELKVSGGSYDTKRIGIVGGKSYDKLRISGSIDYLDTEGPESTVDADRFAGKSFSETPGETDLYVKKTDAFLKLSYGDLIFRGHFADKERGGYIGWANALTDGNVYPVRDFWTELGYSHSFTDRISSKLRIYYDQFEVTDKIYIKLLPEGTPGFPDGMIGCPSQKDRITGTEIQSDIDLFEGNHLIAGVNYEYIEQYDVRFSTNYDPWTNAPLGSLQDVSSWGNFNKDVTREVWAVYIQDEWEIRNNLNLTAGVRYDSYDDFGNTTNPRFGVVWNFLKDAELKLLYGQAFRAPSFLELYNSGNPSIIGDPNLEPEEIKTYEAALGYRLKDFYSINVTYFHNDIDNLITRDTSTSPALYVNRGGAKVDGIETVLRGQYSPANYWQLTYTWQNPEDADTGEELPNVPSQRAGLSLNYGFTKYLNAHTDILWTGKRPRVSGDDRGDMPSYTTVDLSLTAKNFYKNFEIQGTVHNLFDEEYEDPDLSGAQKLILYDYPREGISALIELSYRF